MEQNFSTTEFTNGQIIVGLSSVTLFSRFAINVQNGDTDNNNDDDDVDVVVDEAEDVDQVVVNPDDHSGLYGCEVSADFPEYDTDIRRAHLHVFGKIIVIMRICQVDQNHNP